MKTSEKELEKILKPVIEITDKIMALLEDVVDKQNEIIVKQMFVHQFLKSIMGFDINEAYELYLETIKIKDEIKST